MIEKDQQKRPCSEKIFDMIKNEYNGKFRQNSSINGVIRCLFSFQNFIIDQIVSKVVGARLTVLKTRMSQIRVPSSLTFSKSNILQVYPT